MICRRKVNVNTLTLVVILQGTAAVLFYGWYIRNQLHHSASPKGKVHILLLSSWRSGSSFLGQVFSQHPSVFYLMEPGWHVWTKNHKSGAKVLRTSVRDLLWSLFKCDFSVMNEYLPGNPLSSSLFMWTWSQALCSPPACPFKTANESQCRQVCQAQSLSKAQEACQTYSHVVLKETRFFELESIYPLLQDPVLNLHVVHLVRDPRAVMRSRDESAYILHTDSAIVLEQRNVSSAERQYEVLREICRSHLHIYERGLLNPPPFLEGRYKLVRFEDVAQNPLIEINDIYKFVGLKMTPALEEWIYKMTQGKGKGGWNEAFKITSRNAAEVSEAWRTELQHIKVKHIQEVCKAAMLLLGYKTVNSEGEQKRLNMKLLVPGEP